MLIKKRPYRRLTKLVPGRGLEPPYQLRYQHLKLARLPISPSGQVHLSYKNKLFLSSKFLSEGFKNVFFCTDFKKIFEIFEKMVYDNEKGV